MDRVCPRSELATTDSATNGERVSTLEDLPSTEIDDSHVRQYTNIAIRPAVYDHEISTPAV